MTKRKTKTVAAEYIDTDGFMAIKGELFWKWRAVDTEKRNIELSLKVLHADIAALLDKYPEVKEALGMQTNLIQQASQAHQHYNDLINQIGLALNTDMQHVSIDDQTGRIFQHQAGDQAPVPIRLKARKK